MHALDMMRWHMADACVVLPTEMERPLSPSLWRCCSRCRKTKLVTEFNRSSRGSDFWTKACTPCAAKMVGYVGKYMKGSNGKKTMEKYQKTEKRKITKARHKQTERYAMTSAAYKPRKKELHSLEYERIHSDPGLHLEHAIGVKIGKMIKGIRRESEAVMSYTSFESREDMIQHLKSTFEEGMSFENYGKHRVGGPNVWNVGHRIARFHFDANDPEDVRRCWRKENLFAQWAEENLKAKVEFPSESKLLELRCCWPTSWNDRLPSQSERVRMVRSVFV